MSTKVASSISIPEITKTNIRKNKCGFDKCNKKLSMVEQTVKCRCDVSYCMAHRLPYSHECSYDYNVEFSNKIEKDLQTAIPSKLEKI